MNMHERNGFMTFFVVWLGTIVLFLSVTVSALSEVYLQQAVRYKDNVAATYLAESALIMGWDQLKNSSWDDIPAQSDRVVKDNYSLTAPGQSMRLRCVTAKQQPPYLGTLMAVGVIEKSQVNRTCSLSYDISINGAETIPILTISKLSY